MSRNSYGSRQDPRNGVPWDPAEECRLEMLKQAHAERERVKAERANANGHAPAPPAPGSDLTLQEIEDRRAAHREKRSAAAHPSGNRFDLEDRVLLRRLMAEHPESSIMETIERFIDETGRTMSWPTAAKILQGSDPEPPPPPRSKPGPKPKPKPAEPEAPAVVDLSVSRQATKSDPDPDPGPADVYSAMRDIDAILARLDPATRARVVEWFRAEANAS